MRVVPEAVRAPAAAARLTLAVGAVGMLAGQPWLFPSLGPTLYLQVHQPDEPGSRPYDVVVGHPIGIGAAASGVMLTGAGSAPR